MGTDAFKVMLEDRLQVFIDAGLIKTVPNKWQLIQGNFEMAPYVIIPDIDDSERYAGAKFGNPILRTMIILNHIGMDHFHIGSGLGAKAISICRHLNLVHHQVFPSYDLQLLQTHDKGLEKFRSYMERIEYENSPWAKKRRKLAELIIPEHSEYRKKFIEKNGWIDKAQRLQYEKDRDIPSYLRPEFFSFIRFMNYCATLPTSHRAWEKPSALTRRLLTRFARRKELKHHSQQKRDTQTRTDDKA